MAEVSPRPWRIGIEPYFHLRSANGSAVFARDVCREQDGAYLVRAVNAYDDLLAACKFLLPMAEGYLKAAPSHPDNAKLEDARAAIARAEGR